MKKIKNPWKGVEGYHCFGCAEHNQNGLQMEFYDNGNEIVSYWNPKHHFQGWLNTLHGGVQSALMDEIAAWVVIKELNTCGVTSSMQTRFLKAIKTDEGEITIKARLKEMKRNIAIIECEILNHLGETCSKGEINYFTYSQEQAKALFQFREIEK